MDKLVGWGPWLGDLRGTGEKYQKTNTTLWIRFDVSIPFSIGWLMRRNSHTLNRTILCIAIVVLLSKKNLWAKATINLESFRSGFVFIESCYFYCCHYRRCAITHHNLAASAVVIDGEGRIVWANFGQLTKVDTAREMWIITQQHIARTQKFQVSYSSSRKSNIFVTTYANDFNGWKDESQRRIIFVLSVGD